MEVLMKITVLTQGTRGDVQPYVALGKGLIKRGHQVKICTGATFRDFVESHGIEFKATSIDFMEILKTDEGKAIFNGGGMSLSKILKFTKEVINPLFRSTFDDNYEGCKGTDLIIYHPKALGAVDIAEKLNVPCINMALVPMVYPIREFPNLALSGSKSFGSYFNRLSYKLNNFAESSNIKDINDFRIKTLHLNKRKKGVLTYKLNDNEIPIVHPIASSLFSDVKSWGNHVNLPGFFFLDYGEQLLGDEITRFLNNGNAPIVISFSSMPLKNPETFIDMLIKALDETGNRAIILTGISGIKIESQKNILLVEKAPHRLLFKKAKGIVHHGGAGTSAEALLSGTPQVIMPFNVDQPFWANRLYKMKYALKPLNSKKLTVDSLVETFNEMNDKKTKNKALEIMRILEKEDGINNAINYIEKLVK